MLNEMRGLVMKHDDIKIYHIVHISKLKPIIEDQHLWSDSEMIHKLPTGEIIGMDKIKKRRLATRLGSHNNLCVGECVPFYFCPRSPMLYIFSRSNHPEVEYKGGQEPIVHLVSNLCDAVHWANDSNLRWSFTNSNAGSRYFEDFADLDDLDKLDWSAIKADAWSGRQDKKQAEFLVERCFSWDLIEKIGVYSQQQYHDVAQLLEEERAHIELKIEPSWYY
jgi:hypothetical protein